MNKQVFLVTGVDPSKGTFVDPKTGKNIDYDSTNFYVQTPVKAGHGTKGIIQKMAGSSNYERFKNLPVPCECEFEFNLEFSGQFPKTTLINVTQVKTA